MWRGLRGGVRSSTRREEEGDAIALVEEFPTDDGTAKASSWYDGPDWGAGNSSWKRVVTRHLSAEGASVEHARSSPRWEGEGDAIVSVEQLPTMAAQQNFRQAVVRPLSTRGSECGKWGNTPGP